MGRWAVVAWGVWFATPAEAMPGEVATGAGALAGELVGGAVGGVAGFELGRAACGDETGCFTPWYAGIGGAFGGLGAGGVAGAAWVASRQELPVGRVALATGAVGVAGLGVAVVGFALGEHVPYYVASGGLVAVALPVAGALAGRGKSPVAGVVVAPDLHRAGLVAAGRF